MKVFSNINARAYDLHPKAKTILNSFGATRIHKEKAKITGIQWANGY